MQQKCLFSCSANYELSAVPKPLQAWEVKMWTSDDPIPVNNNDYTTIEYYAHEKNIENTLCTLIGLIAFE